MRASRGWPHPPASVSLWTRSPGPVCREVSTWLPCLKVKWYRLPTGAGCFPGRGPASKHRMAVERIGAGVLAWWGIKMADCKERITVSAAQCGGRPCIRGMRIRVSDVLDLFAAGLTTEQILDEMPDLGAPDLTAALKYAAGKINHPRLAA